jgi:hypothetical protein
MPGTGGEAELEDALAALEAAAAGALPADHFFRWVCAPCGADGAFYNPWCDYAAAMDRIWAAFAAAGWAEAPADYHAWLARTVDPFAPARIALMAWDDLQMLLLAIRRGERFTSGSWAAMLEGGVFLAIARRMVALGEAGVAAPAPAPEQPAATR